MLNHYKNFQPGKPSTASDIALAKEYGLTFLFDDQGHEWYASQRSFSPNTIKVAYDSNNVIRSVSRDVSALWPVNMSVAELEDNESSQAVNISGTWKYNDGKVIQISPDTEQLESQRDFLRDEAIKKITPYMIKLLLKKELPESEKKVVEEGLEYISKLDSMELKMSANQNGL